MICASCNKKNRTSGKFCRFCGSKLGQTKNSITIKIPDIKGLFHKLVRTARKQDKKAIVVAILVVSVGTSTVFAAPKINDYIKVNKSVTESRRLESIGDYNAALAALALTSDRWTFESKRQEIEGLKEDQTKYTQFKELSEIALEKEESGKLAEARELLRTIDTDYPEYEKIKEKLDELQERIENDLKEQARMKELEAQRQSAAAAAARRQAEVETAARTRAEAEKAAADAQSRAAAQAARDSEARRQQEEEERVRQVRISFLNQLVTIYNSLNGDGITYYNRAMKYYNAGYDLTAISVFGQANAIFQKAYSDARSLPTTFSGLPAIYTNAASNMATAANYCVRAVSAAVNETGSANTYSSSCARYGSLVNSFLSSEGY